MFPHPSYSGVASVRGGAIASGEWLCRADRLQGPPDTSPALAGGGSVLLAAEFAEFGPQFLEFALEPGDLLGRRLGLFGLLLLGLVLPLAVGVFLANLAEDLLGLFHELAGQVVFLGGLEVFGGDAEVVGPAFGLFEIGVGAGVRVRGLGGGAAVGVAAEFLQCLFGLGDLLAEFDEGLFFGTRLLQVAFFVAERLEAFLEFSLLPFSGLIAFGLAALFELGGPGLELAGFAFEAFGFIGATFAGGGFRGLEPRLGLLPEFVDFSPGGTGPTSDQQHNQQHP